MNSTDYTPFLEHELYIKRQRNHACTAPINVATRQNKKAQHKIKTTPTPKAFLFPNRNKDIFSILSRYLSHQPLKIPIPQNTYRVGLFGKRQGFVKPNEDDEAKGKRTHTT